MTLGEQCRLRGPGAGAGEATALVPGRASNGSPAVFVREGGGKDRGGVRTPSRAPWARDARSVEIDGRRIGGGNVAPAAGPGCPPPQATAIGPHAALGLRQTRGGTWNGAHLLGARFRSARWGKKWRWSSEIGDFLGRPRPRRAVDRVRPSPPAAGPPFRPPYLPRAVRPGLVFLRLVRVPWNLHCSGFTGASHVGVKTRHSITSSPPMPFVSATRPRGTGRLPPGGGRTRPRSRSW